jgi:acyl-coenzyme A synthetase/AMP-(fatty) acid ligase
MNKHYLTDFPISTGVTITEINDGNSRRYSYGEINARIDAVAHGLLRLKLKTNSRIAVIDYSSYNFVTTTTGIYRSRHAVVPINHKIPKEQIEYCLKDADVQLIFCSSDLQHLLPKGIPYIIFDTDEFKNFLHHDPYQIPDLDENYTISVLYTSGTTGLPKGVITPYRSRLWQLHKGKEEPVVKYNVTRYLAMSPLYHLAGLNNIEFDLFFSSYKSAHIIISQIFNTRAYLQAVHDFKCTHVRLIAPMMSMLLQEQDLLEKLDLSSVKYIGLTSSFAPRKLQDDALIYFKNVVTMDNPYGATETGPVFGPHPRNIPRPVLSAGYPLDYVSVRLDENGVLQIKSPGLLGNYNNQSEIYNKSMTADGYYITGDIFRVNKYGFYFYQGRADDMFKSGGEKIYPSEIESVIDSHPSVSISTVVGVPDDIKGHKPYAFVQLKPNTKVTEHELKEFTITRVATYQIPRHVWILEELPKTNIGKIDKRYLTNLAQERLNNDISTIG